MNALAFKLGLSPTLQFYDVYSLREPSLLSLIPRPVYALLVILPFTPAWHANRTAEDNNKEDYSGKGDEEPVIWFKQTIGHACGSIGLLHCAINGEAKEFIQPGSEFAKIREQAVDLGMEERAKMLYDNQTFEDAHQSVADMGDTIPPTAEGGNHLGQHFVAFVKEGGRLWELEGSRHGPLDRYVKCVGKEVPPYFRFSRGILLQQLMCHFFGDIWPGNVCCSVDFVLLVLDFASTNSRADIR